MKVKILLPSQRVETAGADAKPVVVSDYIEKEYDVEDRGKVRFTTDVNGISDSGVNILVNPNHCTLVRFVD